MKKWIIIWDTGFGPCTDVVEAETKDAANLMAYERAKEDFENSADYKAEEYTEELAEELGVE